MDAPAQTRMAHRGRLFDVELITWTDGQGRAICREVVRHPGAVLVVPHLGDGRLAMVRNRRIAVDETLLELPAGKLEAGEEPSAAAARELEEETGYRARNLRRLGEFYTSPGFSDERMHAFEAEGLHHVGQRLEAGEQIQVQIVTVDEALAMIDDGRIRDGKTIAALLLWCRRRGGA